VKTAAAVLVSGVCALTGASPAHAQPKKAGPAAAQAKPLTEAQKKAAAKKAYKEGEAKFKDGKFAEALAAYKTADDLLPIPKTKYKIAVCHDRLGHVVEAAAGYQTFLDSSPDPAKAGDDIADAKAHLDTLKKTPGKLHVLVTPASAPRLAVAVDGGPPQAGASLPVEMVSTSPDAAPIAYKTLTLPPGHHRIAVTAEGYDPSAQDLDLGFAEVKNVGVTLSLTPPPPPPPPPPVVAEAPPPPPPPPPPPRSNVPAYVTLGLAGAGIVVGTAFGVLALKAKSNFNSSPTTDNADTTDRNALISDMSFAVALTFGVTGLVLLLSNDSPEPAKAALVQQQKTGFKGFVPYAGPNGGGAVGVFRF
jgi:hypothetical protein